MHCIFKKLIKKYGRQLSDLDPRRMNRKLMNGVYTGYPECPNFGLRVKLILEQEKYQKRSFEEGFSDCVTILVTKLTSLMTIVIKVSHSRKG